MNHICASGKRMTELIDDLPNVSRVTTSVMRREKVDLRAIAYEVVGDLR